MPIWKEQGSPAKASAPTPAELPAKREFEPRTDAAASAGAAPRSQERAMRESLIAEELSIEGKIGGSGHVRIAGRFKGDVHVQGNLSIEAGATLTGGVRAAIVTVAGHLEGNIEGAKRVELLETGILEGDLSADSFVVAAGSRMRGKVEFGWENTGTRATAARDKGSAPPNLKLETDAAS